MARSPDERDAADPRGAPAVGFFGAGNRSGVYADALRAAPHLGRIAAVAEPDAARRARFAARYAVPPEGRFESWQALAEARPPLDAVVNGTLDPHHLDSTRAALDAGWHVLLEKPMATDPRAAADLVRHAARAERQLVVCHVLRYTRFFRTVRELVRRGRLGRVMAMSWRENVHELHFAHSFVRGRWRRRDESGPLILTKCSHDLDLIPWILGEALTRVASFGSRGRFHAGAAPAGAAERCSACDLAATCRFDAGSFYGEDRWGWAERAIGPHPGEEARRAALRGTRWERCVWRNDNDVVDRQSAIFESASGIPVAFTVHGHSDEEGRTLRVDGTRATLTGTFRARDPWLRVVEHAPPTGPVRPQGGDGARSAYDVTPDADGSDAHGGGDGALLRSFLRGVRRGAPAADAATAAASLESHLLAFAADRARREGRTVELEAFRRSLRLEPTARNGS